MTVNVSECCGDHALAINASYNHDGQALADMLSDPGNSYIGTYTYNTATKTLTMQIGASNSQQIPVNGKWTPDYSVNLRKVELQMAEGAQIEIRPHRTLAIQGARIQACTGKLWCGVNLLPGAAINVTDWTVSSNNYLSEVSDAEVFISANHLSRVTLNLSTFDKNYISFYVPPATQFPANLIYVSNNLNHFTCDINTGTGELLAPYIGHTIATGTHPLPAWCLTMLQ